MWPFWLSGASCDLYGDCCRVNSSCMKLQYIIPDSRLCCASKRLACVWHVNLTTCNLWPFNKSDPKERKHVIGRMAHHSSYQTEQKHIVFQTYTARQKKPSRKNTQYKKPTCFTSRKVCPYAVSSFSSRISFGLFEESVMCLVLTHRSKRLSQAGQCLISSRR